jgi:hypothetical protein
MPRAPASSRAQKRQRQARAGVVLQVEVEIGSYSNPSQLRPQRRFQSGSRAQQRRGLPAGRPAPRRRRIRADAARRGPARAVAASVWPTGPVRTVPPFEPRTRRHASGNRASSSTRGISMSEAARRAPRLSRSTARKTWPTRARAACSAPRCTAGPTSGAVRRGVWSKRSSSSLTLQSVCSCQPIQRAVVEKRASASLSSRSRPPARSSADQQVQRRRQARRAKSIRPGPGG